MSTPGRQTNTRNEKEKQKTKTGMKYGYEVRKTASTGQRSPSFSGGHEDGQARARGGEKQESSAFSGEAGGAESGGGRYGSVVSTLCWLAASRLRSWSCRRWGNPREVEAVDCCLVERGRGAKNSLLSEAEVQVDVLEETPPTRTDTSAARLSMGSTSLPQRREWPYPETDGGVGAARGGENPQERGNEGRRDVLMDAANTPPLHGLHSTTPRWDGASVGGVSGAPAVEKVVGGASGSASCVSRPPHLDLDREDHEGDAALDEASGGGFRMKPERTRRQWKLGTLRRVGKYPPHQAEIPRGVRPHSEEARDTPTSISNRDAAGPSCPRIDAASGSGGEQVGSSLSSRRSEKSARTCALEHVGRTSARRAVASSVSRQGESQMRRRVWLGTLAPSHYRWRRRTYLWTCARWHPPVGFVTQNVRQRMKRYDEPRLRVRCLLGDRAVGVRKAQEGGIIGVGVC
ncbi:hypothetical protein C8R45DRAFT_931371 [Mycena sanguinolenta]|nr:hypothetical protein C8R45DRAFT_931371 [Mycena sanguinolenta]